jgi:hypothetical protein
MLFVIKLVHTLIWGIMAAIVLFVLWSGLSGTVTRFSWLAALAVACEGIVLLLFKGLCPLTVLARRYSSSLRSNFDIFLPEWLAKYNKLIFGSLFLVGSILMILRYFLHEI